MREVISIHSGQAGIQIGSSCWELYCKEHGLTPDGTFLDPSFTGYGSGFLTFFSEERNGLYRPRSLFVDLEPYALNKVATGSHGSLFGQKAVVSGLEGSGCNSGRAYNLGRELMEPVMDRIRLLLEDCSNCQAFLLFRSIAGGTGSGLRQILLDHLTSEYAEKTKFEFCVYPTAKLTSSALETYNSVISIHQSLDQIDCSFIFENEKVYDICRSQYDTKSPTFDDMNKVIARVVSTITATTRFPGSSSLELAALGERWAVPFRRLHFPIISFASSDLMKDCEMNQVAELIDACFEPPSRMTTCDPLQGKYSSACALYRGDIDIKTIRDTILKARTKHTVEFPEWASGHFKTSLAEPSPHYHKPTLDLCMITQNTAISNVWKGLATKFDLMWSKHAFTHWYQSERPRREMLEAREELRLLELDYAEIALDRSGGDEKET